MVHKIWLALALAASSGLRASPSTIIVGTDYCCSAKFEFAEVEEFAKVVLPSLSGDFHSLMIVPESKRDKLFFGGSSEISVSSCFASAVRIRGALSHAYLLKTPFGASLHHWDSRLKRYQSVVLQGRDLYGHAISGGNVAWIGGYKLELPQVWLVSDANISVEQPQRFAREVLAVLGFTDADVYLRRDPYLWRPDNCPTFTIPLQWRTASPRDELGVSRVTIFCKVRANAPNEACITYRSQ
jgi:hypothetical protein